MSWVDKKLGEVLTLKRGYDLPISQRQPGTVPVVSSSGVTGEHNSAKVKGPGVVTGRYGTLGEVYYIEPDFWPLNTSLYVKDFKENSRKFIFYFLQQILGNVFSDKAAVPGVNRNELHARDVKFPDKDTQKRIARFLEVYDSFIENNRRRIQLLEQAARLLYKEWFVRLRFPGHKHVKVKDGVPEGWTFTTVSDAVDVNPTERTEKGRAIRYIPMSSLSVMGMDIDTRELEFRNHTTSVRFRNTDTLLPRITPCLENGKTAYVNFLNENEVACGSTEFIVLRGRLVGPTFVYCLARTPLFRERAIKSMIGSSGRQRVQTSCFDELYVALPPKILRQQFEEHTETLFRMIANLQRQNEQLMRARDLLLPRLMNGGIAV